MEMWNRLRTTYRSCLLARKTRLQGDLATLKMRNKESVVATFSRARGLLHDLVACGESASEASTITCVMEGLSPEFSNLVETIVFHIAANPRDWSWSRVELGS
jgi:hypothetical protein